MTVALAHNFFFRQDISRKEILCAGYKWKGGFAVYFVYRNEKG